MRAVTVWAGAIVSIALMVLALWAWQHAAEVAGNGGAARPYVAAWAVRSAAVAAAAAAQGVLLVAVVGRLYGRQGPVDAALRLSAAVVFMVAVVSAVALGLAGR